MNREKRKQILKLLNSGYSAVNIYSGISHLIKVPEIDIEKIVNNLNWNRKEILDTLDLFPESHH